MRRFARHLRTPRSYTRPGVAEIIRMIFRFARCSARGAIARGCLTTACTLLSAVSVAADNFGGSLAATSDYRIRGLSQTSGEPAVQAGAHVRTDNGWFGGVWASTIDRYRGPSAQLEVDIYAGFSWNIAPDWDSKVAVTHYAYPNDPARTRYDYDELSVSLAYRSQLVATVAWSPNTAYFARHQHQSSSWWGPAEGTTVAYELTGLHPLTPSIALTAGVGYNDLSDLLYSGYWYWNAGVTCSFGALQFDLARIDSDDQAERLFGPTMTDAGWSAAVSWRF